MPLDFESTKTRRAAPAAHRMPIAEAQTAAGVKLPAADKKTGVFIPPNRPIIYNIGKRLGGEIRTFNDKIAATDSRISNRKRPHIRRGHWHGVWSGTGQNKEFKIYWQPAIFVNAR